MALTKLQFKPGVNKEVTPLAAKGTWVDTDKVRFRKGFPEKIGGWQALSTTTFLGVCRSLLEWTTLSGIRLMGIGTHLKYYVERGNEYYDITPLRATTAAGAVTFSATDGSADLEVSDLAHGAGVGDFVTFSGAVSLGGVITADVLNAEFQITEVIDVDTYVVVAGVAANASDVGNGGASVVGAYQIATGEEVATPASGWGAGAWGLGAWGIGFESLIPLRIWTHANYGEDLLYGPSYGPLYYWDTSGGVNARGALVTGSDVPVVQIALLVSDVSRFVIVFGCNELGDTTLDPMLIRWSDQEDYTDWTPSITNQAGGIRLSKGSTLVTARQNRQEILVWTDTALYSMQYQGPPTVWGMQLLGENISIAGPNAIAVVNGVAYWMGSDKFYRYDGRVQPLECDVRDFVFGDFNTNQSAQVCCGTSEGFDEIWWHYPIDDDMTNTRYVIFNYVEGTWATGTMERTAWLDSAFRGRPVAAYEDCIVEHEVGADDLSSSTPQPIASYVDSADVDLGDGDRFAFVWRLLPDITFDGSTAVAPQVTMTLTPKNSSGTGPRSPASVGGEATRAVARTASVPVELYTEQVNIRVRGRQVAVRVESADLGVKWRLGVPRVDLRADGGRA